MGLTGVILRARIQLTRVETSRVRVDTVRAADIDEAMTYLSDTDDRYGYTVAWLDCLARGASLGRSVITSGDFAKLADLGPKDRNDPLAFRPTARLGAPDIFPSGLINRYTVAPFNEVWFRKAPRRRDGEIQTISAFFHPSTASGTGTGSTGLAGSGSTSSSCRSDRSRRCAGPWRKSARPAPRRS